MFKKAGVKRSPRRTSARTSSQALSQTDQRTVSRFADLFPGHLDGLRFFQPGQLNAITDVPGVLVGHTTLFNPKKGYATGVTAVWPRRDVMTVKSAASGFVLHGAGEMTGLLQVLEWGEIETPILLTSSLNVGKVHDAVVDFMARENPEMGNSGDVILPVVAECDDSAIHDSRARVVGTREVFAALRGARGGVVSEGSVGAGTGMIAFDLKAGIGTSSRMGLAARGVATARSKGYTLGVLVNANVGVRRQLRLGGVPVGLSLEKTFSEKSGVKTQRSRDRSVIVVVATDAPLRPDQIRRVCVRAAMGLARVGSFASHGSGEIVIGFSAADKNTVSKKGRLSAVSGVELNSFYEAAVEAVEEAVLNALVASAQDPREFVGKITGTLVAKLPVDVLK